jgi:anti-sigma B factor antagonist
VGPLALVVLDVAGVGFTNSTALGTLIRINRRAAEHGARCEIRNVPDRLHRLLAMTGLDRDLILT